MEGTYENIKRSMEKRSLPTGANINLEDQFSAFFTSATTYYSLLLCYDNLKKVHKNLHAEMIGYNAGNSEDDQMDALDFMLLVKMWNYYRKVTSIKGKPKGKGSFFENYLYEETWKNIGLSSECVERINDATYRWNEEVDGKTNSHTIKYMDIESKMSYIHLLRKTLTRKRESIEDSVNALLTTHAEEQIIGLLDANQAITDINLFFQLSMITGWLTCESMRNVTEKKGTEPNAYFTARCNINPQNLIISINNILEMYLLPNDKEAINKLKRDLAIPEKSDKTASGLNNYLKLYEALVPCSIKWADQYEEVWRQVENDSIYQELTEKLK